MEKLIYLFIRANFSNGEVIFGN